MGAALDPNFRYNAPAGIFVAVNGSIQFPISSLACASSSVSCSYQLTVVVNAGNVSSAVDFVVLLTTQDLPVGRFDGYLVSPKSSRLNSISIQCDSSDFFLPANSTFRVSECSDLANPLSFPCSTFAGVCPAPIYAYVRPYYLPQYERWGSDCLSHPSTDLW
jgi:hypothetical protein